MHKLLGYVVHTFTASGAVVALFSIYAILENNFHLAIVLMGLNLVIDGIDGTLARAVKIKQSGANINGELLDNIIDYVTYVLVPCLFIYHTKMLPESWMWFTTGTIMISSAYQFTQTDAKSDTTSNDHYFKGFPDYWNLAFFYLYLLKTTPSTNNIILLICVVLIFIPIKYIYPSRPESITNSKTLQNLIKFSTLPYGLALFYLLLKYPHTNFPLLYFILIYSFTYLLISLKQSFKI